MKKRLKKKDLFECDQKLRPLAYEGCPTILPFIERVVPLSFLDRVARKANSFVGGVHPCPLPSLPRIENPALFQPTRLKKALQEKILMFEGYLNDPDNYHVEQLEGYEEMLVHLRYLDGIVELEDTF